MKIYIILVFAFLITFPAFAQEVTTLNAEQASCEMGSLEVDNVLIKARESKEKITVLFYQGKDEKKKKNLKRLETIKETLLCMNGWEKLVENGFEFKAANEVAGKPKVEFYVGEKLHFIFYPNSKWNGFCTYCCYEPKEVKQILKNCRKARKEKEKSKSETN